MRRAASAVCIMLLLAGCSGGGSGTGGDATDESSTSGGNRPTVPPSNKGPDASLTANVTSGTAPLDVRFSLSATDPDGDALSWTLDVEGQQPDSGTGLPATVERSFGQGSWSVTLIVSDGSATDVASVSLLVSKATEPPVLINGTVKGVDPSANATVAGQAGGCRLGDPATPGGPVGGGWHDLPAAAADRDYAITPAGKGFVAYFLKADGASAGSGGETGIVPVDAAKVRICTANPTAGATYAFTAVPAFRISSTAFAHNGRIPEKYSCNGGDHQPPLAFRRLPDNTTHLALVVEDPDAPAGVFIHWAMWDLPASVATMAEDVDPASLGATEGENDFGKEGWGGPCPPPGTSHRYHFRLYALSAPTGLRAGASAEDLRLAMQGKAVGETALTGIYP